MAPLSLNDFTPSIKINTKRSLSNLLLLTFSVGFSLILAEVGLREASHFQQGFDRHQHQAKQDTGFSEYDQLLGWHGKPRITGFLRNKRFRHNSQGFREEEVSRQKKKGFFRILFLGDSQTWGLGVEEKERFSNILQSLFRKHGFSVEILNFGAIAYGTDQELLLYKKLGPQYQPDLVIVGFFWNDLFENVSSVTYEHPKPLFVFKESGESELTNVPVPRNTQTLNHSFANESADKSKMEMRLLNRAKIWLMNHSYVFRLLADAIRRNSSIYGFLIKQGLAGGEWRNPDSTSWKVTKRLLEEFRKSAASNKSRFLVMVLPERADFETFSHRFKSAFVNEMKPLPVFDPFMFLMFHNDSARFYYLDDIHLSSEGHRAIAHALFGYLKENVL